MRENYSISFNLEPLQIHPEQARASRDPRGYVRHVVDIWSISISETKQCLSEAFFRKRDWVMIERRACRFKMLSDSCDGWAISTKSRVDRVCYSSNPDNSLRSPFKKRESAKTLRAICVLVIFFYFKSIFAFHRAFSWLYSAKSLRLHEFYAFDYAKSNFTIYRFYRLPFFFIQANFHTIITFFWL